MPHADLAQSAQRMHHRLMEYVLLALAGGAGLAWLGARVRAGRAQGRQRAAAVAAMRTLCAEDVALLGEDLRRLGGMMTGPRIDEAARGNYRAATVAHRAAQQTVASRMDAHEISEATQSLARGRYALACVRARLEDRPVPEPRMPCFFNPQHGPSLLDVYYTYSNHGTHRVPACASDVAHLKARESPEILEVEVGGRRVPYFAAGDALAPYGEGYFAGDSAIQQLFLTSASWAGADVPSTGIDRQGVRSDGMFG
jgi:hypothetical protein